MNATYELYYQDDRAVISRHLAFTVPEGTLSMTQYYGTCRGLL
jgi:hypothetical protein